MHQNKQTGPGRREAAPALQGLAGTENPCNRRSQPPTVQPFSYL